MNYDSDHDVYEGEGVFSADRPNRGCFKMERSITPGQFGKLRLEILLVCRILTGEE